MVRKYYIFLQRKLMSTIDHSQLKSTTMSFASTTICCETCSIAKLVAISISSIGCHQPISFEKIFQARKDWPQVSPYDGTTDSTPISHATASTNKGKLERVWGRRKWHDGPCDWIWEYGESEKTKKVTANNRDERKQCYVYVMQFVTKMFCLKR